MKTIIIASDYSATANNALQYAASLARVFKADLLLFNVFHPSVHVSNSLVSAGAMDHIIKNNEDQLNQLAAETARQYQINVTGVSRAADTIEALEDYISSHPADLLVMGMDSGLTEYQLFGNTTTAAIRRLKCPVLVVPNDVPFKNIQKILYACEYTYLHQDNHLDLLREITRRFAAELRVFHVETEALTPAVVNDQIRVIDALMKNVDHTYTFAENADIIEGIIQEVEEWPADLLVMVPHKAGFWESLLKVSNTREMALRTRIPLLILPNIH